MGLGEIGCQNVNSAVKLDSMNPVTTAGVNCARPHVKDTI